MVYDDDSSYDSDVSTDSSSSLVSTGKLHPSLAVSLTSPALDDLTMSNSTILIYNKTPSARKRLRDILANNCKRVICASSSHDAIDIIKRNNSDVMRTRNAVKAAILSVDNSSVSISRFLESRGLDEHFSQMPTVPIIFYVEEGSMGTAKTTLTTLLNTPMTAGYVFSNIGAKELVETMRRVVGKYSGVHKAYAESTKVKQGFKFPKWRGIRDMDSIEEGEMDADVNVEVDEVSDEEEKKLEDCAHAQLTTAEQTEMLREAWYNTKLGILEDPQTPKLKLFASHVINSIRADNKAKLLKHFTEGGSYEIDTERLERKVRGTKVKAPKVGLSKKANRVVIWRKGKRAIGVKTPKNELGFFVESDEVGEGKNTNTNKITNTNTNDGADSDVSTSAMNLSDLTRPKVISSSMEPFIIKQRPNCEEFTKTSFGLNKKSVSHLKNLRKAHKNSKMTTTNHGSSRRATAKEEIIAMDNLSVLRELGMKNKAVEEPDVVNSPPAEMSKFAKRFLVGKDTDGGIKEGRNSFLQKVLATRPTSAPAARKVSIAQVAIAASARKKETVSLASVMKEAREVPKDLLQYDLIEIKPSEANSSKSNHLMRAGYKEQELRNYKKARELFTQAIVAEKYNLGAWFCRGVANDKCGDFLRAIGDFSFCLKFQLAAIARIAAKKAIADSGKGTMGNKKGKVDIYANVDDIAEIDPSVASGRMRKGKRNIGEGSYEEIHKITVSRVYFNRAMVHVHLGNDEEAIEDLTNALKRNPKDKVARGARAMIFRRIGEFGKSQADYHKLSTIREHERKTKEMEKKLIGGAVVGVVTGSTPLAPKSAGKMKSVHAGLGFDPMKLKLTPVSSDRPKSAPALKNLTINVREVKGGEDREKNNVELVDSEPESDSGDEEKSDDSDDSDDSESDEIKNQINEIVEEV